VSGSMLVRERLPAALRAVALAAETLPPGARYEVGFFADRPRWSFEGSALAQTPQLLEKVRDRLRSETGARERRTDLGTAPAAARARGGLDPVSLLTAGIETAGPKAPDVIRLGRALARFRGVAVEPVAYLGGRPVGEAPERRQAAAKSLEMLAAATGG